MSKDWIGNDKSPFATLASSHHSSEEREINDYYATDPRAVEMLLELEKFNAHIWEPCCGEGHISRVLENHDYDVYNTDIIDRGYSGNIIEDLVKYNLELTDSAKKKIGYE